VPLREETLPIHNIIVGFKGYDIRRIHLEPGATDLAMNREADVVRVKVPKLAVHAMVVAELR
jgi:hypothetical protein